MLLTTGFLATGIQLEIIVEVLTPFLFLRHVLVSRVDEGCVPDHNVPYRGFAPLTVLKTSVTIYFTVATRSTDGWAAT